MVQKLKDLTNIKITKKAVKGAAVKPVIVLSNEEMWASLEGCVLLLTDQEVPETKSTDITKTTCDKYPEHKIYGEYALDMLLKDLPMETLLKYKVLQAKAPPPVVVDGKKKERKETKDEETE